MKLGIIFETRNARHLAKLRGRLEILRERPGIPDEFYRLGKGLEFYRDFLAGYLNGLPDSERRHIGAQIWPTVGPITEEACKLAEEAQRRGIIPEWLFHSIGTLVECIAFTALWPVVDSVEVEQNPRRRQTPAKA